MDGGADDDGPRCSESEESPWQGRGGRGAAALGAVMARLPPEALRRAGAVCRAWRSAAQQPALWRRALLPHAAPAHVRALRRAAAAARLHTESSWSWWSWRREYFLCAARWTLRERRQAALGASVTHAALSHAGDRLAITADDASLTMWDRGGADSTMWRRCWQRSERARGWLAAGAVRWAPADRRLLMAGPLALADRWEILVLRFDDSGQASTEVRAESGACGGCWVDGAVFATVTVRLLAPGRAVSTLWLNAAEQKLQSEYAGVTAPVLRIYNESAAHISHLLVANVPVEDLDNLEQYPASDDTQDDVTLKENECGPAPLYWQSTLPMRAERQGRVVVAAVGAAGSERGVARALAAWRLPLGAPPPLLAAASLAQRVRARRPPPPALEAPPPSEDELRALCAQPLATQRLRARVLGLQIHPNGGCLWASTRMGAECVSLPALKPLLRVSSLDATAPTQELPYLLQPAVSNDFIITPAGDGSGRVRVWAARSGARGPELPHSAPATAALLSVRPHYLLVLAGDSLYERLGGTSIWSRGASKVPPRSSCAGGEVPPCADCVPRPAPPCRAEKQTALSGVRRTCRPPPRTHRPPCAAPLPPCTVTCEQLHSQNTTTPSQQKDKCATETRTTTTGKRCGDTLDRVAQRTTAAKFAHRLDYEREVAAKKRESSSVPPPPTVNYILGSDREIVRAADGQDYVVLPSRTDPASESKTKGTIQLDPAKDCEIKRSARLDPCAHQPRIILDIDRSDVNKTDKTSKSCEKNIKNHRNDVKHTVSKKLCKRNSVKKLTEWCSAPPDLAPDPSRCRQPSLVERLKRRSKSSCNPARKFHTIPHNFQSQNNHCDKKPPETDINNIISRINADKEKFDKMMIERSELNENARGRTTGAKQRQEATTTGQIDLQVPSGTHSVRVQVGLYAAAPLRVAAPNRCVPSSTDNVPNELASFSEQSDSWLSIKNIQKKLSNCRKESAPPKHTGSHGCSRKHPASNKPQQNTNEKTCQPKLTPEPSPCAGKQPNPTNPCQIKQKPKKSPCDTKPSLGTHRCSSMFEFFTVQ